MENVKQIWQETAKQLEKVYDRREAENITYLLFEDLLAVEKAAILAEERLEIDIIKLTSAIERLINNEPIQHITGTADFYGLKFEVSPDTLIPRPETEELVDLIIRDNIIDKPRILDVGVGSGCIAITLAVKLNGQVFGTDISETALAIARKNQQGLNTNVKFYQSDILQEDLPEKELDILVSNPPYIPKEESTSMRSNVIEFEPSQALFVPNEDPLLFYRSIAERGKEALKKGGKLYFEIHEKYGVEISSLLERLGYSKIKVHQDMQGKDRIISAINSTNK